MKYYTIVEMDITDPSWIGPYVERVTEMIARAGGRYLARTDKVAQLEGDGAAPQIIVLIEWPSKEAADAMYASEEYKPFRESRIDGTRSRLLQLAGEDMVTRART